MFFSKESVVKRLSVCREVFLEELLHFVLWDQYLLDALADLLMCHRVACYQLSNGGVVDDELAVLSVFMAVSLRISSFYIAFLALRECVVHAHWIAVFFTDKISSPSVTSILAMVERVRLCCPLIHLDISAFVLLIAFAKSVLFQPFRSRISVIRAAIANVYELIRLLSSGIMEYNSSNRGPE